MRGTAQHRHRSFVPSSFVILYIFITALHHRRAHADAYSLSLSLSLSLCAILLPVFFPAFRFHVHGYQSVVVIHQRPSAGDASRADLLDLEE